METKNNKHVESLNEIVTLTEAKNKKREMLCNNLGGRMSGIVGGALGATLGSMIARELQAHEKVESPVVEPEPIPVSETPQPMSELQPEPVKPEPIKPELIKPELIKAESKPELTKPESKPEHEELEEMDVQVVSYKRITTEDGQTMQTAVINDNGEYFLFADINNDDIIDYMAFDINNDGSIGFDEAIDVAEKNWSMSPLREAYEQTPQMYHDIDLNEPANIINDDSVDTYII